MNEELKIAIETIKIRFKLNQAEIAKRLNRSSTYISDVINGRVVFSEKLRDSIYEEFQIRIAMPGESESINQYIIDTDEMYKKAIESGLKMLPEVDFEFSAGSAALVNNTDSISRYWYLPDCEDCEAIAPMTGNSMLPMIPPGCNLVLKRYGFDISKPNLIAFGNVFGVVVEDPITGQWHGHVKILRRHKDPDMASKYWIAHSFNSLEFDDFDIEIAQVRGLWIVKQHVVMNALL